LIVLSAWRRAFSLISSEARCAVRSVFLRMASRSRRFVHHRLQVLGLLVERVALVLEGGQLFRHQAQVRPDLFAVVPAPSRGERLPLDVHGRDLHRFRPP